MPTITVELTDFEHEKLQALAKAKGETEKGHSGTIQECIKRFAQSCVPGGSGWKHPSSTIAKKEEPKDEDHQDEAPAEEPKGKDEAGPE